MSCIAQRAKQSSARISARPTVPAPTQLDSHNRAQVSHIIGTRFRRKSCPAHAREFPGLGTGHFLLRQCSGPKPVTSKRNRAQPIGPLFGFGYCPNEEQVLDGRKKICLLREDDDARTRFSPDEFREGRRPPEIGFSPAIRPNLPRFAQLLVERRIHCSAVFFNRQKVCFSSLQRGIDFRLVS